MRQIGTRLSDEGDSAVSAGCRLIPVVAVEEISSMCNNLTVALLEAVEVVNALALLLPEEMQEEIGTFKGQKKSKDRRGTSVD